MQSSLQSTQHF
uniref:Uncharacterized protein n=1 Tax=Arundo donax TaxID=35708 RepID=A0A0A9F9E0_ARUDO